MGDRCGRFQRVPLLLSPLQNYLSSEGELTGCTDYFTNLYSRNGVFIVVTSDPTRLPRQGPGYIMSGPVAEDNDVPAAEEDRWMVLDPEMALHVLGGVAVRKGGTSVSLSLSSGREDGGD